MELFEYSKKVDFSQNSHFLAQFKKIDNII